MTDHDPSPLPARRIDVVVMVHYHLRAGGVTTVIRRLAAALREMGYRVVVASGEAPGGDWPEEIPVRVHPRLGYREERPEGGEVAELAGFLQDLAGPRGVLHFHNPTLGKSGIWPELLARLTDLGQPMLMHVHDFLEDGRDSGAGRHAARDRWYPDACFIRWITVNPDDRALLVRAGLADTSVDCLPNPVEIGPPDERPAEPRLVVSPVRGIRRKNTGEFLLLAALAPPGWRFVVTMEPEDARQARRFRLWKRWSQAMGLPVRLGGGWPDARPAWCLATSIQEGFGLSWVEPWARGIPVTGRWLDRAGGLPDALGWQTPAAYTRIEVPARWIPCGSLRGRIARAMALPDSHASVEAVFQRHFAGAMVDFGRLPEVDQRSILRRMVSRPDERRGLRVVLRDGTAMAATDWFHQLETVPEAARARNAGILEKEFAIPRVATALARLVEAVASPTPRLHGHADASMIAAHFQAPEHFHFLRLPP